MWVQRIRYRNIAHCANNLNSTMFEVIAHDDTIIAIMIDQNDRYSQITNIAICLLYLIGLNGSFNCSHIVIERDRVKRVYFLCGSSDRLLPPRSHIELGLLATRLATATTSRSLGSFVLRCGFLFLGVLGLALRSTDFLLST